MLIGKISAIIEPTLGMKLSTKITKAQNTAKSRPNMSITTRLLTAVIKLTIVFIIKYALVSSRIFEIVSSNEFFFSLSVIIREIFLQIYLYSKRINKV